MFPKIMIKINFDALPGGKKNFSCASFSELAMLKRLFSGNVLIILRGLLRIWGLRSEICRLVPLDYVDYLTV